MCGIAGYSCFSEEYDPRLNVAITILALAMETRGRQSWGWTDGDKLVKATGNIETGFNASFHKGYLKAALHTRHATHGGITKENAHPFQIGDIIGMHNGVLRNHDELNKKYERKFDVDSMHIFAHLSEGKSLEDISGYGAICFFKDGVIHLGRFNNGDLCVARTETAWVFASTQEAVKKALRLAGMTKGVFYYKLKEGRCYKLVGKELVRDTEYKLDFANYCKSYGTWESGAKTGGSSASTTQPAGFFQGGGYNRYPGYQGGRDGNYDRTQSGQSGSNGTYPYSRSGQGNQGTVVTINDKRRVSVDGTTRPVSRLSTQEKVEELIRTTLSITEAQVQLSKPQEASWKCGRCSTALEGIDFHLTEKADLICTECSLRYAEELVGGPFTTLPVEIILAASIATPTSPYVDCDHCNEIIGGEEFIFIIPDNDYICMSCFVSGDGEPVDEDAPVDDGVEDLTERLAEMEKERERQQMNQDYRDALTEMGFDDPPGTRRNLVN